MADFIDKAMLIGLGIERKLCEIIEEFEKKGKEGKGEKKEGLPPKERLENRLVQEGTKLVKELFSVLNEGKEKIEKDVYGRGESIAHRLNLVTKDELDIVKEMARIAREKADKLEKRLEEIESKR